MKHAHAIARARERYHADLTPGDVEAIRGLILSGDPSAVVARRKPGGAVLFAVRYKPRATRRRWFAALWYDGAIVTVLPPDTLTTGGWRWKWKAREKAMRRLCGRDGVSGKTEARPMEVSTS